MDRGAWRATVCGVTKNQTWLSELRTTPVQVSGFPGGARGKEPSASAGDVRCGSIPGWERSPGGGHRNPESGGEGHGEVRMFMKRESGP